MQRGIYLGIVIFMTTFLAKAQQITVNNSFTAQHLIENIFLNGNCTQVSNVQAYGHTFSDGIKSWGYFNNNNTTFPLNEGILLTTGKLTAAPGPNPNTLSDGPQSWLGDQDLEYHVGINSTYNATYIEFDFVPTSNTIKFEYVFASEQYLLTGTPGQCYYTDGFAFLLQNLTTGGAVQNLALVPNTNTPVTSSTIRGAGGLCSPSNPQYFDTFNTINSPIAYNGNTLPLQAQATVIPGNTYHIKMVIADQGNQYYDSAVFLKAYSFSASIDLGENRLLATGNPLCGDETLVLNATLGTNSTYVWKRNGTILNNQTGPQITINDSGHYEVTITQQNGCVSTGEITIEKDTFTYQEDVFVSGCAVSGNTNMVYNLIEQIPAITDDAYNQITFYQTNTGGVLSNPINNTTNYSVNQNTTVYAKIISETGCEYISEIHLQVSATDVEPHHVFYCDLDGNTDGIVSINGSTITEEIKQNNNWNNAYTISYHSTVEDAISGANPFANTFTNTTAFMQTIYARVLLNGDCHAILPVQITIQNSQSLPAQKEFLCKGSTIELQATANDTTYVWNTGETTRSIEINSAGIYSVTYINEQGCELIETFQVILSDVPESITVTTSDFAGSDNTLTVNVSGLGSYEYSLDGVNYQESNVFTGLEEGDYTIYIRDKNGCGVVTTEAAILDYPKFFTPNGDGINDIWKIKHLAKMDPKSVIHIFDRYNRLIVVFPGSYGWDGTRNGTPMYSTDYWFTVTFSTGKILRGHFHLKR